MNQKDDRGNIHPVFPFYSPTLPTDPGATQPHQPSQPVQPYNPFTNPVVKSQDHLSSYQPVYLTPKGMKKNKGCGCWTTLLFIGILIGLLFYPFQSRLLIMGVDRPPEGTWQGRTDTIIIMDFNPWLAELPMLSIPRDLWVVLPDNYGENRINAAHFFAEIDQPGSGPFALMTILSRDFGVTPNYYLRLNFEGVVDIIDAMGGVNIDLTEPMGGLEAGSYHLDGTQALAFIRSRAGTDDFFRMEQGQFMVRAIVRRMLNPLTWFRIPFIFAAVASNVDTNLPIWVWPRLGMSLALHLNSIDNRTIDRDMVTGWTTDGGAQVLLPNWELIWPVVQEMFP
ncbi:MAG TPA: LCP family protein [Longilinea sp.]|nr:LCP family protein [Longilinea sp.]